MRGKPLEAATLALHGRNIPAYAGKTSLVNATDQVGEEHPRVCGENRVILTFPVRGQPTSPRMRGKPDCRPATPASMRNIPAYAGKTWGEGTWRPVDAEHPRVCGENRQETLRQELTRRNIPAYAGKTGSSAVTRSQSAEHPRVCGENFEFVPCPSSKFGTSPRMRGKLVTKIQVAYGDRNIPAYAGKTVTNGTGATLLREHPRVCGENPI